jgi:hypothetical protein
MSFFPPKEKVIVFGGKPKFLLFFMGSTGRGNKFDVFQEASNI